MSSAAAPGAFQSVVNANQGACSVAVETSLRDIERADYDRQHVVEVVGDAAGELTDALHLLHLSHLGLRCLAGRVCSESPRRAKPNVPAQEGSRGSRLKLPCGLSVDAA